jgi:uncharacterized protein HemX
MDGRGTRKFTISVQSLMFAVGLGALVLALFVWHNESQARQRAEAEQREARMATVRAEAEAQRVAAERQAARIKGAERVTQLYREIERLSQMGEHLQTSLPSQSQKLNDRGLEERQHSE